MSNRNPRFYVTLMMLLFFLASTAQIPGQKYFIPEKDNGQIKINTLLKTSQGYLYAGTDKGLYKFDGERYTPVSFENPDYTDTVTAIFQDNQQKIWVGFKSGRIANISNRQLAYINPEEGVPTKRITSFLQDKENNLWLSTNGEGIYVLKNKRLYLFDEDDGLSDPNVSTLLLADNGDILAGTDQGINICSYKNGKKNITVVSTRQGLPDYIVTSIRPAGKNCYWIGLQDKGFCLYNHSNARIQIPVAEKDWNYGEVSSMLQVNTMLWIATKHNGLYKYCLDNSRLEKVLLSIGDNTIDNLLQDNQGNIWLTTPSYGMLRTPGETLKLMPIPNSPDFEHIHAILCDKQGNIWFNNEGNDLIKMSVENGMIIKGMKRLHGLYEKIDITSLYQDENENIWVGTMGKGLFIVDPYTFKSRAFTENTIFRDAGILSINGTGNSIYISSLQGSMEIKVSPLNRNINKDYIYSNYDNDHTGTNYIYSIFRDSRNRIWFATDGKGLTMLHDNVFTYYNSQEIIKDLRIYSITEDNNGNIWFSTASAGVYKFDGKQFTNFALNQGISNLDISVLKTDNSGNIIIVHKKGLDILDPRNGNISYVSSGQGISMINSEDIGAVTKDTSGNVMVSTQAGLLSYAFPVNSVQKPTALIESVQLFLKDIGTNTSDVFDYDENNFTFNYTGLYYTDPEKVYYQYKLEGLDNNWVLTKDRRKNFPKLAPGKYTFRIRASLNKNFKNADEASYAFTIKQAFYKTYLFFLACAILISLLTFWYIKNREKALKKIERLRQEKIQFRFEVLRNQVNPHFLFNSFNTLISTIEEEPKIAVEYAEQLSDFFRNIVNQRDKELISLRDEIEALHSYSFLQQKRYGSNLQVNIDITKEQKIQNKIPPLTMQLLMENAIKHNTVSKESPLIINITIREDSYLDIKNNISRKTSKQEGTGMGLQNIINRYNLITKKPVKILNDDCFFIVSLPLLK